jgi:integrase
MARSLERLPKTYKSLKPGLHADGGNLYLQISVGKEGNRRLSWIFRYRVPGGRLRDMGLGSAADISLREAREKAREYRLLLREHIDPIAHRDARRAENRAGYTGKVTFDECAARYIEAHEAGWRNPKHRAQWESTLRTYASPVLGAVPVEQITTEKVLEALRPLWLKKPETASRVRQRIERVLDAARVQGLRGGENPARWRGHLDHLLPPKGRIAKVEHHAAMPYHDVLNLMAQLRDRTEIAAKALAFTILTACRTGEVIGAKWSEIDWEGRTWTIPGARMKAQREHRVPLSEQAQALLQEMASAKINEFVFPSLDKRSRGALSNMAMAMMLRRMGYDTITVHGFRSAFRDWAGETTSFPQEICEAALAHTLQNKVEAAYRRGDALERRRELMSAWASHCLPPADGKILQLKNISQPR